MNNNISVTMLYRSEGRSLSLILSHKSRIAFKESQARQSSEHETMILFMYLRVYDSLTLYNKFHEAILQGVGHLRIPSMEGVDLWAEKVLNMYLL